MAHCIDIEGNVFTIKHCPFCGKEAAKVWSTQDKERENGEPLTYPERFTVVCDFLKNGCGATCGYHDTAEMAVNKWNTRVVL